MFGQGGVLDAATLGSVVIDMSSVSPVATKQFATRLGDREIAFLHAPALGSDVGAPTETLTIIVGGPAEFFDRVPPIPELWDGT